MRHERPPERPLLRKALRRGAGDAGGADRPSFGHRQEPPRPLPPRAAGRRHDAGAVRPRDRRSGERADRPPPGEPRDR
ncbi:hypothetical protein DLJ53_30645 [Acuticoccus sediminis]|uniref:Uncharacterized protein n=1 Tax=Acuticoccus sediminis TaxID=2184697 RepID=A0A8B2NGS9_9HYPH|nr:hypothetical protein DLJ53_30645 [Acuticoccus sediminis]